MNWLLCTGLLLQAQDGWSELRRGEEKVEVYRDSWGIPHIFAPSLEAAFWAEGVLEAEDRFPQMEKFRRGARGESAELAGKEAVAGDLDRRKRGYTAKELREMYDAAGERFRRVLQAYADGVNEWLSKNRKDARRWDVTDSIAIGVMMSRKFGEAGDIELTVQQVYSAIVQNLGEERARTILDDILRLNDPSAPTTLNDHLRSKPEEKKEGSRGLPAPSDEWYVRYRREIEAACDSDGRLGLPTYFGSNAWVVSPSKSRSGNVMLYGGPMMGFGAPSICNEVHICAPGYRAAGMSFPGSPGVLIGFNETIAWTTTSGGADLVDVYVLELNPENPEQYRHGGGWKDFEKVEHEILVAEGEAQKVTVYRSVYGPLAGDRDLKKNRAYALAMSFWKRETDTFETVMNLGFASNLAEFRRAVSKIATSHNFFVADSSGHIGFWYCGRHPRRKAGHDPRFVQPGDGSMDWEGLRPFEEWPQSVDPPHGFFANWNNKPARDWEVLEFGKIFWGKKIIDELERNGKVDLEKVWSLARETAQHAYAADYFLPFLLPHVEEKGLKGELEGWDRMSRAGEIGTELVDQWLRKLVPKVFGKEFGVFVAEKRAHRFLVDPLLYVLEGDRCVFPLRHEWGKGRDLGELSKKALEEVLAGGREKLAYRVPEIDFKGTIGKIASEKGRGTYQIAVEMTKEGPVALTVAAPGQSGSPESPHYADQIPLFREWKYKKLLFDRSLMK